MLEADNAIMRQVYVITQIMQMELHQTRDVLVIFNREDFPTHHALPMLSPMHPHCQDSKRLSQKHHG